MTPLPSVRVRHYSLCKTARDDKVYVGCWNCWQRRVVLVTAAVNIAVLTAATVQSAAATPSTHSPPTRNLVQVTSIN